MWKCKYLDKVAPLIIDSPLTSSTTFYMWHIGDCEPFLKCQVPCSYGFVVKVLKIFLERITECLINFLSCPNGAALPIQLEKTQPGIKKVYVCTSLWHSKYQTILKLKYQFKSFGLVVKFDRGGSAANRETPSSFVNGQRLISSIGKAKRI